MDSLIKSDEVCEQWRKQANELYNKTNYVQALELYNKALCYAENIKSKEAGICFANRSAVFCNLSLPEAAIENIQLARNAGYPAELMDKLNDREKKCLEMMNRPRKVNPAKDFFKLSYPAHEKTPFLANCVEMRETKKYGRGLYATRDLKPGDIITNSRPVLKSINKNAAYKRCTNCLEVNDMNLFSCPSCVGTMFCSTKCQEEAMEKFHKYECPYIDEVRRAHADCDIRTATWRFLLVTQHAVDGIKKLKALVEDWQLTKKTFFDYDLSKDCKELAMNEFLAAYSQTSAFELFTPRTASNALFEKLSNDQPLRSLWKTLKEKQNMKAILQKTSLVVGQAFRATFDGSMNNVEWQNVLNSKYGEAIGGGIHLPFVYFNHSCSPNVNRIMFNDSCFHFVIKPVKKDEQLFEAYW